MKPLKVREAKGPHISGHVDVAEAVRDYWGADREHLLVVHLNSKGKIIEVEVAHIGTLNKCAYHPREIFRRAIINSSNAIVLAHNHPSGDTTPSAEDIMMFKQMRAAGDTVCIEVVDSVIVAAGCNPTSLRNEVGV